MMKKPTTMARTSIKRQDGRPTMVHLLVNSSSHHWLNICQHRESIILAHRHRLRSILSDRIAHMAMIRINDRIIDQCRVLVNRIFRLNHGQVRMRSIEEDFVLTIENFSFEGKCVLVRDPSFHGCGFRMIEKENYDTPLVVEVRPNSPAKRRYISLIDSPSKFQICKLFLSSGLCEGDHIIYIESRNVQAVRSFDEMTLLIQRTFEETGQVTLVTLTAPAYQVLKRRGGYLQPDPFDYQLPFVPELVPRLCRIVLYNHEQDFGFTLQRGNPIHIKDVHPGSPAYEFGLRVNDKILEINGRDTTHLASEQIIEMIEASKRRRQLEILVIDLAGYEYSLKHALPLNSLLPFVQSGQRRGKY